MKKNIIIYLLLISNLYFGYYYYIKVLNPPELVLHHAGPPYITLDIDDDEPVDTAYYNDWEYDEVATYRELDFYASYHRDPEVREKLQKRGFGIGGFTSTYTRRMYYEE